MKTLKRVPCLLFLLKLTSIDNSVLVTHIEPTVAVGRPIKLPLLDRLTSREDAKGKGAGGPGFRVWQVVFAKQFSSSAT